MAKAPELFGGEDVVVISRKHYDNLMRESHILELLQAAGVDNWEWYGDALAPLWDAEENDK